ncbi:MAG: alanyl-tRNA editing protein [Clostridia bacterium]|nr:alanyl-tRNA editing protein [Clostridia bacterium]
MTIKLYDEDPYIKEFTANVVSCEKDGDNYRVILDRTAFFPTEGGQYHDGGSIAGMKVLDVLLEGDEIVHVLPYPIDGFCRCEIDFGERFDKMQQHTGEHIVCGIVHRLYGYENVGFHLGADDVTFDFNGMLTDTQVYEVERLANEAVFQNRAVKGYYPEDPKALTYRSKLDISENLRIVEIEGIDMCACCAPHVKTTGEVGFITFTDWYSYKGGIRIHLACGQRAIEYSQNIKKNLFEIAKKLSAKPLVTAEFFEKYEKDVGLLKQTLSETKKEVIALKAKLIEENEDLILFEDMDLSLLQAFTKAIEGKYTKTCMVFCKNADRYNYIISSKSGDIRDLTKRLNEAFNGKGGGRPNMTQGSIIAQKEEIEKFIAGELQNV